MLLMTASRFKRMTADVRLMRRQGGPVETKRMVLPPDADPVVLKDYFGGAAEALGDRQFKFTISTAAVDRENDVIDQSGWELAAYRLNPVLLWEHGFDMIGRVPIGRCISVGPEAGALKAVVELDPEDDPISGIWSEMICRKLKRGSLSATSVGFIPLEFDVTKDPARGADDWLPGFDFRKQQLYEFSIVAVPCNPDAVIDPAHREDVADPLAAIRETVSASAPTATLRTRALQRLAFDRRFPA